MTVGPEEVEPQFEKGAQQLICAAANPGPSTAPESALYRIAGRDERRIANDDVKSAARIVRLLSKNLRKINVPREIEWTIEIHSFELAELDVKLVVVLPAGQLFELASVFRNFVQSFREALLLMRNSFPLVCGGF